ncbi:MAG: AMP-binding protein, partial [Spirosoma sp.]|nr:AMP-binding protein [Spirosoma sp.]
NLYGPTEDTTYSTGYRVMDGQLANRIGRSKQGSQAYVLGTGNQLQPIGVVGEICLSGAGVARGYYNQPVLSRERFGVDPFGSGGAMYRTGDLGYWDETGQMVCIGRKDTQIKLRGYRIELGEIEKKLEAHADVKQAILVVQGGGESQRLVAYYEGVHGEVEHLAGYLGSKLPSWMVPDAFVCLAEFPLTPNGKIDRRNLSERVTVTVGEASEAVVGTIETQLRDIWEAELGLTGIGRHDNFFRIGGHSLKAVRLISRIRETWQIDLPLKMVFLYPTIAQLAATFSHHETAATLLPTLDHQDEYEVSPGQLVWLTKYRYALERVAFNMQAQSTILNLNLDAFTDSIAVLIDRHESLRSRFVWQGNRFVQRIADAEGFDFEPTYIDVRQADDVFTTVRELTKQRIDKPFDYETGPLFAIQLYRLTEHDYRVAFIIDHVISDAWSLKTIQDEFTQLYDAFYQSETNPLKPLSRQYKDFSAWHRNQLLSDTESKSQAYWRQKLASVEWGRDLSHVLSDESLQREHSYARYIDAELERYFKALDAEQREQVHGSVFSVRPLRGLSYQTIIPESVLTPLKHLAQETNASLFSVLSASMALLVHSFTGRKDVLIGTPVSLRGHQDFDALVGWFLDTLLLHNPVDAFATVREVVQQANANNAEAHEHRYYPFERVLQDSDASLDAIGSVFMHLLNGEEYFMDDGFVSTHHPAGSPTFDINFTFNEYKNCLMLTCDYRNEVFSPASIERVIQAYLTILGRMGTAPGSYVADILPIANPAPQVVA